MADLPLLPQEGESLDLKSGRFRDKKTGRYSRRVDMEAIVATIRDALKHILAVDEGTAAAVKKAELIQSNFKDILPLFVPTSNRSSGDRKQAIQKAKVETKAAIKSAGMNILGLVGLIALLKSDRIMAIVGGFFKGFLKALGWSNRSIAKLFLGVKLAIAAFEVYLGYKVFKSVLEAFNAMKRLGQALGFLTQRTQLKGIELAAQQMKDAARIRAREVAFKAKESIFTKVLARTRKIATSFFKTITSWKRISQTIRIFYKRTIRTINSVYKNIIMKFKNFKTLVFTGLRLAIKGISVAKVAAGLASFGIGWIIGGIVEAGLSTALDYWIAKETGEGTPNGSELVGLFTKNFVGAVTLGLVDGSKLKDIATEMAKKFFSWFRPDTPEQKAKKEKNLAEAFGKKEALGPTPEKIASEFPAKLTKKEFDTKYEKKYLSLRGVQTPNTIKRLEQQREAAWVIYQQKNVKDVGVASKPTIAATTNTLPATMEQPSAPPAAVPVATVAPMAAPTSKASVSSSPSVATSPIDTAPTEKSVANVLSTSGASATNNPFAGLPSYAGSDASVNNPGSFLQGSSSVPATSLESTKTEKQMTVASLSQKVSLDKKEIQQTRAASAGALFINNINNNNIIGAQTQQAPSRSSTTIFSDTVGY